MSTFIQTGVVVGLVVTDPEEEHIGTFEDVANAEAFVRDYKGGVLRLKVIESKVYRYSTLDAI